ncbi:lysozyme [Ottowia oryzae]
MGTTSTSSVPVALRDGIVALFILMGIGGSVYLGNEQARQISAHNAYIQAVAADTDTSDAVKIAMVMGSFYESSYRHIGKPYVDYNGKGRPLSVCNGITGKGVVAGRTYSPTDCYRMEKARYIQAERDASAVLAFWDEYDAFTRATFVDFVWNKGFAALEGSSMIRLANTGQLGAACAQNTRWNRGTVNGVSKVLPGLTIRGNANAELCFDWSAS